VRTLAEVYRHAGEDDAASSPLQARVALALCWSDEALRAIGAAPARARRPAVVLAALHDLALAGRAPALAAAYAAADGDAASRAAVDTLLRMPGEVAATAARRRVRADVSGRGAVLHPAVAEAARRAGATAVGLVDVGCAAGLNLTLDPAPGGVGVGGGRRGRTGRPHARRPPGLRPQHRRRGGARGGHRAGRGRRPVLVARPPAGVAGRPARPMRTPRHRRLPR
jgi:Uncharacterized protein conserved in bacteria (DUF2332)